MHSRARLVPAVVALVTLATTATGLAASSVKAPRSGTWAGYPGGMTMYVSGKSLSLVAFSFKCGQAHGRTSLNDIRLKKTKKGYTFSVKTHGNVTYTDDQPDENAAVRMSGRFSKTGKSAAGTFRVRTPRCGSTGDVKWRAFR
jgi:hypothetical protein